MHSEVDVLAVYVHSSQLLKPTYPIGFEILYVHVLLASELYFNCGVCDFITFQPVILTQFHFITIHVIFPITD